MNRLHKKCLIASMGMHGLLCLVLVVGLAFKTEEKVLPIQTINIFDAKLIDGATQGGGNPNVQAPPKQNLPPPAQEIQKPAPKVVEEIKPVKEVEKQIEVPKPIELPKPKEVAEIPIEPPKKTVKKILLKETVRNPTPEPVAKKTTSKIELKPTVRKPGNTVDSEKNAIAEREASQRRQLVKNILGAASEIRSKSSGSTTVEMPGTGGAAFVNYGDFVKTIYERAWLDPEDVSDESANVKTEIIVERDGTILSARIQKRSGVPALDKSVQRALDRVKSIRPFPEGSTDRQRTFIINFNLKAKRQIG